MLSRNELGKLAEQHNLIGRGAMIGIQYGLYERKVGEDYKGVIHCIDLWEDESIYQEAKKNLLIHPVNHASYYLHKCASLDAVKKFEDESLDFVYIDANHFYEPVTNDMNAWFPKVRKGGIFAGHDYCTYKDIEVEKAVNDWMRKNNFVFNVTTSHEDSWNGVMFPTWWMIKAR